MLTWLVALVTSLPVVGVLFGRWAIVVRLRGCPSFDVKTSRCQSVHQTNTLMHDVLNVSVSARRVAISQR